MSLIVQNLTTIESLSLESEYALKEGIVNPYDLGSWKDNLDESLGGLMGLVLPLRSRGNGRVFTIGRSDKSA